MVLYLASSAALLRPRRSAVASRWLAAIFPPIVLGFLYASGQRKTDWVGRWSNSTTHVLGVVSLAAMLTIAARLDPGPRPRGSLALRLWLFGGVYLAVARAVLLSVRRQAIRTRALATPTLIVGAGMVGEHLVKRLVTEPSYGLRPVGYLDDDPLPGFRPAGGDSQCSAGSTNCPKRWRGPPRAM